MKHAAQRGVTWWEVLVLIAVLGILASLALPAMLGGLTRGRMTQILSDMKQLHLATQQWTLDNQTTGQSDIRWTCSNTTPISFAEWTNGLVPEYIGTNDMKKLLSHTVKRKLWFDKYYTNVMTVFAVTGEDPGSTVLLATGNWKGVAEPLTHDTYGEKGFIIFRKGGDGAILQPKQASATNIIGSGGMHNYLPLR